MHVNYNLTATQNQVRQEEHALLAVRTLHSYSHGCQVMVPVQQLWDASSTVRFPSANNHRCKSMRCGKHIKGTVQNTLSTQHTFMLSLERGTDRYSPSLVAFSE
jgi:hypothetical protein